MVMTGGCFIIVYTHIISYQAPHWGGWVFIGYKLSTNFPMDVTMVPSIWAFNGVFLRIQPCIDDDDDDDDDDGNDDDDE